MGSNQGFKHQIWNDMALYWAHSGNIWKMFTVSGLMLSLNPCLGKAASLLGVEHEPRMNIYIYNQRIWFEYGCWLIFHKRGRHPFIIIWSINQFTYCTVLANLTCFDSGANMNGKTTKHRATIGTCWTIIVRWSMFFSGHWATRFKKDFELTYYSWSFYWQPVRQDGIDMPIAQMMLRCIYVLWFLKDTSYSAKVWLKSGGCCWCSILEGIQSNSSDEPKCKWDMTAEIWGLIARWRHYNRTYRTLTHG